MIVSLRVPMLSKLWNSVLLPIFLGAGVAVSIYFVGYVIGTQVGKRIPTDFPMNRVVKVLKVIMWVILAWGLGTLFLE